MVRLPRIYHRKKKDICNLSTLERGHNSVKGDTKQNISQITILLN